MEVLDEAVQRSCQLMEPTGSASNQFNASGLIISKK